MTLKIYNSLTRKKEDFKPVETGKIKMYVCGMTVYSDTHIGHARTYFAFDIIRRYFEYKGFRVTYVQNITDVDDKIIAAATREGVDPLEYSKKFTTKCLDDLDHLGIRRADLYPKASETIDDMIKLIEEIIKKGYGYESEGDVYFSVEKFAEYGKLSGQKLDDLMSGVRIDPEDKKHNPFDFALWKSAKPGEPRWESPWGMGRPGWHIECSAMSSKFLGLPFDIHGGGMDLRFPHHENEIAQAEAATGKQFARFWMHAGLLTINGEKMSKSIGNIINIKDLLTQWDAEVIRFFFAQTHYRRPPDYTEIGLENAKKGLERIHRFADKLMSLANNKACMTDGNTLPSEDHAVSDILKTFKDSFESAMDDDFNTPIAVAALFDFISETNRYLEDHPSISPAIAQNVIDTLKILGRIITLFQDEEKENVNEIVTAALKETVKKYKPDALLCDDISVLLTILLSVREEARKNRKWVVADAIRSEISCLGFEIQDTSEGVKWRKS